MAAAYTDLFTEVGDPGTATTLSSPGYTSGVSTTITVGSTSGWPTATGVIFVIDEVSTVDGVEVRTDGTYNEYSGTVTNGTLISNVTWERGDGNRNYPAGATTRVYIGLANEWGNRMAQGMYADHKQLDGGHKIATNYDPSNPTLETQKWAGVASAVNEITVTNAATGNFPTISATGEADTGIDFENSEGEEILKLDAVPTGVNEITITNAVTTAAPVISATGGDTDININLTPKGTGYVNLNYTGAPIQTVSTATSAVATGTTTIPADDTIPQNTEGDEYMTLAITPKSATNILVIQAITHTANTAAVAHIVALFQDSTANALAAIEQYQGQTSGSVNMKLTHRMVAGTTSATTFKIRIGGSGAGTTSFNGVSGTRRFGAITKSSIVITEYQAS